MATRGSSGARRGKAEPLTASWRLDMSAPQHSAQQEQDSTQHDGAAPAAQPKPGSAKHRSPGGFGWRIYALPVLVIVTVLVVVNTARHGAGPTDALAAPHTAPTPVVTEGSVPPVDTGSGTAVLPPGPAVPELGAGTWHVVPGNGPIVGRGPHVYRYQVAVEDGVDPSLYGGDDAFAAAVAATLADPRGWIAGGTISLQRVDASYPHPDFIVSLTTPGTDHRPDLCGFAIPFETSCWQPRVHRVIINVARWVRGALAFDGDLGLYRQYVINNEVGRVLGNNSVGCAGNGGLAPVMMEQTFGVSDDYLHDLDQIDPAQASAVPADGKECRPNAWPYPLGTGDPTG